MAETNANIVIAAGEANDDLSLLDILDHILNKGVVIRGKLIISLAGVDLIYVGLDVLLTSVETALAHMQISAPGGNLSSAKSEIDWFMALLAYCIAEAEAKIVPPGTGVQGSEIVTLAEDGLVGFMSQYGGSPDKARGLAVEFHRVLQEVLRQAAIVPFRFPTLLANDSEMIAFLKENAKEYRERLDRLRDVVQMEVQLSFAAAAGQQKTGTAYLQERQKRHQELMEAAEEVRVALGACVRDWRAHGSSSGMRCYVLVARDGVETMLGKMRGVALAAELRARVTGPWAATEFM